MPAHITHEVFAREVFDKAFSRSEELGPFGVFGAQGPDFCLHNHRTKPTALIFGQLLHTEAYGIYVRKLVDIARKHGQGIESPFGIYTAAFATHAILDRITHPFINYFSGWVTPDHPESDQYYNCHAFLERIIDVFVLRSRTGESINGYDFLSRFDCGENLPEFLETALSTAIVETFPIYTSVEKVQRRMRNAYLDTRGFYTFTNPAGRENLHAAFRHGKGHQKPPRRLLALFHPDRLPDLDYLNAAREEWNHPGIADEMHTESFIDLYEQAVEAAVPVVQGVAKALNNEISGEDLEKIVGNENLSDGRTKKARRKLELVKPLPLQEVLRTIYIDLEKLDAE
jgi:hypothetical protein